MDCKLILIEGLCGTGKSTLAGRLGQYLTAQGRACAVFEEGAYPHPASLNSHAFLRREEYQSLLRRYPQQADSIRALAIEGGDALLPFRDVPGFAAVPELLDYLKARDLCWAGPPAVQHGDYSREVSQLWARLTQSLSQNEDIVILEGVFLQHPIHDLTRSYSATDEQLTGHILSAAAHLTPLKPMLLYLSESDVRQQQQRIAQVRQKPHYANEASIAAAQRRRRVELMLLPRLPFATHIIDNSGLDWQRVYARTCSLVEAHLGLAIRDGAS